ncbi:MAG: hypothetical protein PHI32_11200, partial [Dysgonamonadaceae bacterium]|nr:hypothetical protein [Dysgonamonadaceae bacterium]
DLEKAVLLYEPTDRYIDVLVKAESIREEGYTVSIFEKAKKLGKQLNQFQRYGYKKFAVYSGEETELKDLN